MKVKIVTRFAPVTLEIKVKTTQSMKLQIIVSDADDTTRKFTNRYKTVNGEETLDRKSTRLNSSHLGCH
jgi:hypothetical protein